MANLRLIQHCMEFVPKGEFHCVGRRRRGIYVLYQRRGYLDKKRHRPRYEVLYVGMADASMRARLRSHAQSRRKKKWTHFSIYQVWPNVTEQEIRELEGLFRHIYRYDRRANVLNLQRGFQALRRIRVRDFKKWQRLTQELA